MKIKEYLSAVCRDFTAFASISFSLIILGVFFFMDIALAKTLTYELVIAYAVVIIIRSFYFKHRPNKETYQNFFEKLDASSFPSLHSCRAALLFFFLSHYFQNWFITSLLIIIMGISMYSRIYLKKHDIIDVVAGFAIGTAISFFFIFV